MTRWQRFLWRLGFTGYARVTNAEELLTSPARNAEFHPPPRQEWTKVVDGVTYRSYLREAEPGIYHVTAEVLEGLLRELGWEKSTDGE